MDYKKMIDKLLEQMEQEITSAHELTTKALNHEYNAGKLYELYHIAEQVLPLEEFIELYEYRREDRERISLAANRTNIDPVYVIVREKNGRNSAA